MFSREMPEFQQLCEKLFWKNRLSWKNDMCQYLVLGSDFPSCQLLYPIDQNSNHFEKTFSVDRLPRYFWLSLL